jgi:hypothetical protein
MFVWSFIIVHGLKPDDMMWAEWHQWVREGMVEAAKWLIENNLRRDKWKAGAGDKYHFDPRDRKYLNKKMFAKFVRDPETGIYVPPRKPTQDLVYIGYLVDYIKGKPADAYNIEKTSVQTRVRVRVPIPTPHRMQKAQYEELGEWTLYEYVAMRRILFSYIARKLGVESRTMKHLERIAINAA